MYRCWRCSPRYTRAIGREVVLYQFGATIVKNVGDIFLCFIQATGQLIEQLNNKIHWLWEKRIWFDLQQSLYIAPPPPPYPKVQMSQCYKTFRP